MFFLFYYFPSLCSFALHSGEHLKFYFSNLCVVCRFYLFIYFGCSESSLLGRLFSGFGERGPLPSCGTWASHFSGLSCCGAPALEHGLSSCGMWPSCPAACEILLDQGPNPCTPNWQADSSPLSHQGSPWIFIYIFNFHFFKSFFSLSEHSLLKKITFYCCFKDSIALVSF